PPALLAINRLWKPHHSNDEIGRLLPRIGARLLARRFLPHHRWTGPRPFLPGCGKPALKGLVPVFHPAGWCYHASAAQSAILGRGSYLCDLGRRTMLNRGVVIVRPKQPYLDWAAGLDDSELVPDPNAEQTVYLIPSYGDDEEAWEILERVH